MLYYVVHVVPVVTYSVYSQHSCTSKCCLLCQQFTDAMPKKKKESSEHGYCIQVFSELCEIWSL